METVTKLAILADAAKYDASCASSGAPRRSAGPGKGIGSTTGMGICHSFTPDGRCVSLLKILLTNFCLYDCQYCINRRSSDVQRARFGVEEVVQLTLDFYRRNYIEGLFLSSGVIRSSDYTMERLVEVARALREDARVPRLYPPEDDPGGEPGADRAGRPLCGSPQRQHRIADGRRPRDAGAGEDAPDDQAGDGRHPHAHRRPARRAAGARCRREGRRAEVRAGGAEHAAHRGRRSGERRDRARHGRHAVPFVPPATRVLLRVQSDPERVAGAAESRATAVARAPAVSGGLAAAVLRLHRERARRRDAGGTARSRRRSEDPMGAGESRGIPRRRESRATRAAAARAGSGRAVRRAHPAHAPAAATSIRGPRSAWARASSARGTSSRRRTIARPTRISPRLRCARCWQGPARPSSSRCGDAVRARRRAISRAGATRRASCSPTASRRPTTSTGPMCASRRSTSVSPTVATRTNRRRQYATGQSAPAARPRAFRASWSRCCGTSRSIATRVAGR